MAGRESELAEQVSAMMVELGIAHVHDLDELWSVMFTAPVGGVPQPVSMHGVTRDGAEQALRMWRQGAAGQLWFDVEHTSPWLRQVFLKGWPFTQIQDMQIMPMREAL